MGGELYFHFSVAVVLTALVAMFVLWRYRALILVGMSLTEGKAMPVSVPEPGLRRSAASAEMEDAGNWERGMHRRVMIAWLVSVGLAAIVWALLELANDDQAPSPARLTLVALGALTVAAPMISVSLAWPFWRGVRFWLWMLVAGAIATVAVSMLQRLITGELPTPDQLLNAVLFLQFVGVMGSLPALLLIATGASRIRGVAPITFAGLLVFGLAPFFGGRLLAPLLQTSVGIDMLQFISPWLFMHVGFLMFALPVGWVAWKRLQSLASRYEAKRFSDVQLLARTWWLMFIVSTAIEMFNARPDHWWYAAGSVMSYVVFVQASSHLFKWLGIAQDRRSPRTLLLLRVFGYTPRTEKLFDRVGARWRYFGPVTMIAAPDVVARTLDPGDYLHFITGSVGQTFVRSAEDLQRRLAEIDMARDPDGRYRVNEFCCADNTWQATIVELMQRCDVVLMDLRGITRERRGCEFELQQLAARVEADRVVLVIDSATDRAMVRDALGEVANAVAFFELNDTRPRATDSLFQALLRAAR